MVATREGLILKKFLPADAKARIQERAHHRRFAPAPGAICYGRTTSGRIMSCSSCSSI